MLTADAYLGCFANEGAGVRTGDNGAGDPHIPDQTYEQCHDRATNLGKLAFGFEYPHGQAGQSSCLLLDQEYSSMATAADSECEQAMDSAGHRLGSGNRLAVYATGDSSAFWWTASTYTHARVFWLASSSR